MPLISIGPKNTEVQDALSAKMTMIRPALKRVVFNVCGFPENDVIVNLLHSDIVDADNFAADFVVFADTCPHKVLEARANELRTDIANILIDLGFTDSVFEVWLRFLPGPWCLVVHGRIIDTVDHPR